MCTTRSKLNTIKNLATMCTTMVLFLLAQACTPDNASIDSVWTKNSQNGLFEVTIDPRSGDSIALNEFLEWTVTIKNAAGQAVSPAQVSVSGGMPAHGHGFPSQPQIEAHSEPGKYLLKGLKFSMKGRWAVDLDITAADQTDKVAFDITLDY